MNKKRLALVPAKGLGDAIIWMALYQNLKPVFDVVLYSNILSKMKDCFFAADIRPLDEKALQELKDCDKVLASDHACIKPFDNVQVLFEGAFDKEKTFVDNLLLFAKEHFGIQNVKKELDFTFDKKRLRREKKRVLIHPFSKEIKKNWPQNKFVDLAKKLELRGFQPVFCMEAKEKLLWKDRHFKILALPNLCDFAALCHESGYFIGNDSGPGHLCSALGVPTLSIFARASYAKLWRPAWGEGVVVSPFIPLFGAAMKNAYWQRFLSVKKVFRAFEGVVKKKALNDLSNSGPGMFTFFPIVILENPSCLAQGLQVRVRGCFHKGRALVL